MAKMAKNLGFDANPATSTPRSQANGSKMRLPKKRSSVNTPTERKSRPISGYNIKKKIHKRKKSYDSDEGLTIINETDKVLGFQDTRGSIFKVGGQDRPNSDDEAFLPNVTPAAGNTSIKRLTKKQKGQPDFEQNLISQESGKKPKDKLTLNAMQSHTKSTDNISMHSSTQKHLNKQKPGLINQHSTL